MRSPYIKLSILFSLAVASAVASAQGNPTSFADIVNGTNAPTLKIADLTPEFKAMKIRSTGDSSGMMSGMGSLMMAGMMGGSGGSKTLPQMLQVGSLGDLVWTKGQTFALGGHEFLVTYRLVTGFDPGSLSGQNPKMAASLNLDLIRTDAIISISPNPGVTPDSLRKTLASAGTELDVAPFHMDVAPEDTITAAILFPVFAQAHQAAERTTMLSKGKQLALAMIIYCNDYDDVFPYVQSTPQLHRVLAPYTKSEDLWTTNNPNGGGFRFAMNLAGVTDTEISDPAQTPMLYESNAWPDGRRAVAFADGHAKMVSKEDWTRIEPRLNQKYPKKAKFPIKIG